MQNWLEIDHLFGPVRERYGESVRPHNVEPVTRWMACFMALW